MRGLSRGMFIEQFSVCLGFETNCYKKIKKGRNSKIFCRNAWYDYVDNWKTMQIIPKILLLEIMVAIYYHWMISFKLQGNDYS